MGPINQKFLLRSHLQCECGLKVKTNQLKIVTMPQCENPPQEAGAKTAIVARVAATTTATATTAAAREERTIRGVGSNKVKSAKMKMFSLLNPSVDKLINLHQYPGASGSYAGSDQGWRTGASLFL